MARVTIDMPDTFVFSTELDVRISDINYANHLGHDAFISLLHEARIRFLHSLGYTESDIEGLAIIIADLAVVYKVQAAYGSRLRIEIAGGNINKYGCDLFYRVTRIPDNTPILEAKTGIVFFEYLENRIARISSAFSKKLTITDPDTIPVLAENDRA
jgi:acyl-CoA thioester hydrolase